MNNLPEIRDIYIPEGVSIFPIAYGWWVVLGIVLCLFLMVKFIFFLIRTSKKHYALQTLKEVKTDNPVKAAIQISNLLRRISNLKYKEGRAIYGEEWVSFLNDHTPNKLSGNAAKLLMFAPFISIEDKTFTASDVTILKDFSKTWIGENL